MSGGALASEARLQAAPHIARRPALGLLVLGATLPVWRTAAGARPASAAAVASASLEATQRALLGTRVDVVVDHADADERRTALDACWMRMTALHHEMNHFAADSRVSVLARAAGAAALSVSADLMAVLRTAQAVHAESDGAFDPTVGAYSGWHFDGGEHAPPTAAERASQRRCVGFNAVALDTARGQVRLTRPGMRLDLGGVAKLPILQAGLDTLRQHGIRHALINGGGDVLVLGRRQGQAWRVGVRDPLAPQRLAGVLHLADEAVVASSGTYERMAHWHGQRYHHILDPRSGLPAAGPEGVALIARDVNALNGLGAAIMVAGLRPAQAWLRRRSGVDALVAGAHGRWTTAGMARKLTAA